MKKNNLVNSKSKSWIKPIYTLFVVTIPAILIWIFFSGDLTFNNIKLNFWIKLLIAIIFLIAIILITSLLTYLKIIPLNTFTFVLPITICFMVIFLSQNLVSWARALIIIPFLFLIIPINMIFNKIEIKQKAKNNLKNKNKSDHVIGHLNNKNKN